MKRKVVKIGPSTLMVSLPSKWVKENNIRQGEELEANLKQKEIIFSKEEHKLQQKEITLDVTSFNTFLLVRYLEMLYLNNYHKITFLHNNSEIEDEKNHRKLNLGNFIKHLSNRFIGMEVVSQTATRTELQCFLLYQENDLDKIEKRIYFLVKESFQEMLQYLENDYFKFHEVVPDHHDSIVKFIAYYLRILDQSDKSIEEKRIFYSLYLIIDQLIDRFRHISRAINKYGCTPKVKKLLQEVFEFDFELFQMLHKEKINSGLIPKRYDLIQKLERIDYTKEELMIVLEAKAFLDVFNDFARAVIVKEMV